MSHRKGTNQKRNRFSHSLSLPTGFDVLSFAREYNSPNPILPFNQQLEEANYSILEDDIISIASLFSSDNDLELFNINTVNMANIDANPVIEGDANANNPGNRMQINVDQEPLNINQPQNANHLLAQMAQVVTQLQATVAAQTQQINNLTGMVQGFVLAQQQNPAIGQQRNVIQQPQVNGNVRAAAFNPQLLQNPVLAPGLPVANNPQAIVPPDTAQMVEYLRDQLVTNLRIPYFNKSKIIELTRMYDAFTAQNQALPVEVEESLNRQLAQLVGSVMGGAAYGNQIINVMNASTMGLPVNPPLRTQHTNRNKNKSRNYPKKNNAHKKK